MWHHIKLSSSGHVWLVPCLWSCPSPPRGHNQQLVTVINCYHWTDKGDDDKRHKLTTEHDVKSITWEIKLLENIVHAVIAYLEEIPECIFLFFVAGSAITVVYQNCGVNCQD